MEFELNVTNKQNTNVKTSISFSVITKRSSKLINLQQLFASNATKQIRKPSEYEQ